MIGTTLLTCEHAANTIPDEFRHLFTDAEDVLNSHRGWDPGAAELAECMSNKLKIPLISFDYSRLLIEPNRSEHHPKLFSEFTKKLPDQEKNNMLFNYYRPHHKKVQEAIYRAVAEHGSILHIGVHTFTPELDEKVRGFDIGLLYDPSRPSEKQLAKTWKNKLSKQYRIRMNQPYKGKADGLITTLRKLFSESVYTGIELEVNQKLYYEEKKEWRRMCNEFSNVLSEHDNQ